MTVADLWTRRGRVIRAPQDHPWWGSHAQTPMPVVLGPRHWRIYFSVRSASNKATMIYADVDPGDDMRVLDLVDRPLLDPGKPGCFDSAGRGVSFIRRNGDTMEMYYIGMHLRQDIPYQISVGLALSTDGGDTFERAGDGPVFAPNLHDPYFISLLYIDPGPGPDLSCWYMTGTGWEERDSGVPDPIYGLRRGYSSDNGRSWRPGEHSVGLDEGIFSEPVGLARPWVATIAGQDRLFFSHRNRVNFRENTDAAYRIMSVPLEASGAPCGGPETLQFTNPPQPGDWDAFMQAYPSVIPYEGGHILFYNGNGFGQLGFGWATLGL